MPGPETTGPFDRHAAALDRAAALVDRVRENSVGFRPFESPVPPGLSLRETGAFYGAAAEPALEPDAVLAAVRAMDDSQRRELAALMAPPPSLLWLPAPGGGFAPPDRRGRR